MFHCSTWKKSRGMALEFGIGWPLLHNDPHVYCSGGQCLDATGGVSRLKGILQFWINILHVIFDDLCAQKNPRLQGVFFLSLHVYLMTSAVLIPRLQEIFWSRSPRLFIPKLIAIISSTSQPSPWERSWDL